MTAKGDAAGGHLRCPRCDGYDVGRLYVAATDCDACECVACGHTWDQRRRTGEVRGPSETSWLLRRRQP